MSSEDHQRRGELVFARGIFNGGNDRLLSLASTIM